MSAYILYYAPDNASLIIRLALEELHVPYTLSLVDRRQGAQHGAAYKSINPVGRIPALETADGPMFETAAIGLWLSDRHRDHVRLSPATDAPERGRFLSWLFFLSNTVHAELRSLFYPHLVAGQTASAQAALSQQTRISLNQHFQVLNDRYAENRQEADAPLSLCDLYLAVLLRWPALYPMDADRGWFDLTRWPALLDLARRVEARDSAALVAQAEGLGPTPFSSPSLPNPPEGSAV
ncbi:glutathione S-transferase family protein [Marivita sp. S6314]|uniref:glutathione S-transferase family protein n=1 Tax=Marivita sp. S6314 TaxID=2926406 RepID=UPI001FF384C2|nr:glutathione S-transferase family protein [Marivita sp. S6314]MCK0149014.1 glutathione S-transferase family protein [Marivita sp. S6314]